MDDLKTIAPLTAKKEHKEFDNAHTQASSSKRSVDEIMKELHKSYGVNWEDDTPSTSEPPAPSESTPSTPESTPATSDSQEPSESEQESLMEKYEKMPKVHMLNCNDALEELLLIVMARALTISCRGMSDYCMSIAKDPVRLTNDNVMMTSVLRDLKSEDDKYVMPLKSTMLTMSALKARLKMFKNCIDVRCNYLGMYTSYTIYQQNQMYIITSINNLKGKSRADLTLLSRGQFERMWTGGLSNVNVFNAGVTGFKPGAYFIENDGSLTPHQGEKIQYNQIIVKYERLGEWIVPTGVVYSIPDEKGSSKVVDIPYEPLITAANIWGFKSPRRYKTYSVLFKVWKDFNMSFANVRQIRIPVTQYTPQLKHILPLFVKNYDKNKHSTVALQDNSVMSLYVDNDELVIGTVERFKEGYNYHIAIVSPEARKAIYKDIIPNLTNEKIQENFKSNFIGPKMIGGVLKTGVLGLGNTDKHPAIRSTSMKAGENYSVEYFFDSKESHLYTLEQSNIIALCIGKCAPAVNTSTFVLPNGDGKAVNNTTPKSSPFRGNPSYGNPFYNNTNRGNTYYNNTNRGMYKRYPDDGVRSDDANTCAEVFYEQLSDLIYHAGGFNAYIENVRSKYKPNTITKTQYDSYREK